MQATSSIASNVRRSSVDVPSNPVIPARSYYISAAGSGNGLTSGTPAPISTLLAATLNPGDQIFLNKGDSFIIPGFDILVNGVTIQAYGTGAKPKVYGSTSLSSATWTDEGSGQWSTPLASMPKWVYIDGLSARLSETAWITCVSAPSAQVRQFNGTTIAALGNIVGSIMVPKEFAFRLSQQLIVTNNSSGSITFTGTLVGAAPGMPAKFYNKRQFITSNGDWCYDSGKLYVKSAASPAGTDIKISAYDYAFYVNNAANVTIDGLDMQHYFKYATLVNSAATVTITNNTLQNLRGNGIRVLGSDITNPAINSNTILNCALRGIETGGINGGGIMFNNISFIGTDSNLGHPYDENKTGGAAITRLVVNPLGAIHVNDNCLFAHNVIHDIGYEGIATWGNNNIIEKNHIYNYLLKFNDGGGVYLSYGNYLGLASSTRNNIVRNNIIHDGVGNVDGITGAYSELSCAGIYFDNGQDTNTITDNFIYNPGVWGILENIYTTVNTVTNNKIVGGSQSQLEMRQDANPQPQYFDFYLMQNCVVTGNVFVSNTSASRNIRLQSVNTATLFKPFVTLNNNHYLQPYATLVGQRSQTPNNSNPVTTDYNFSDWKTYTTKDASSTSLNNYKVTPDSDDVMVEANPTDSPVNFNVPAGYTDVYGNAFSNPVSIPAWSGLIYIQNP